MINIIVAYDQNRGIGYKGAIPWHCSEDLKFFKAMTTGHTVIMGRKTYESIGRPLFNRTNIVVTSSIHKFCCDNKKYIPSHPLYCEASLCHAIQLANSLSVILPTIWIIGGESIYKQALDMNIVDNVYATIFEDIYQADKHFPLLNTKKKRWGVEWIHNGDSTVSSPRFDRYRFINLGKNNV